MARLSGGANVPISSAPASSSNVGSSNSSGSDLNGTGTRSVITTDEKLDPLLFAVCTVQRVDRANPNSHELDVPYGVTYHEDT